VEFVAPSRAHVSLRRKVPRIAPVYKVRMLYVIDLASSADRAESLGL